MTLRDLEGRRGGQGYLKAEVTARTKVSKFRKQSRGQKGSGW